MKAKIYTKTGDKGQTSLVGGTRVPKTHQRLEAYGCLDELNSAIGLVRCHLEELGEPERGALEMRLQRVQNALFNIGSHLACETEALHPTLPQLAPEDLRQLETDMDEWENELPPLKNFILPGGTRCASFAHLARTFCRRAERETLRLADSVTMDPAHVIYLNRLSDWLFLLARKANSLAGEEDILWSKS